MPQALLGVRQLAGVQAREPDADRDQLGLLEAVDAPLEEAREIVVPRGLLVERLEVPLHPRVHLALGTQALVEVDRVLWALELPGQDLGGAHPQLLAPALVVGLLRPPHEQIRERLLIVLADVDQLEGVQGAGIAGL